jgi:CheY-like chemotaxis protein
MNADEDLGSIERAGRRAAELTGQLLAFARRQVIEPRIVDLNALTGQIDRMLRRLLGEQVLLQTQLHPELWPVKVDPAQMEQVLVNLAVNARDAMPMGGTLTLETANVVLDAGYVAVHADVVAGEYVMVAVSDNGEGIDPAFLPMIFEPFFTTKPNGAGTGLGLATCYGIIKQAGGHIWAYSEPGRGATFKLYLPRAEGEASELTIASPATTARGDETVLLVEDDADVRAIGVRALRGTGFRVLEAADGVDALAIARAFEGTIHILVTDVVMPRMGGKELAAPGGPGTGDQLPPEAVCAGGTGEEGARSDRWVIRRRAPAVPPPAGTPRSRREGRRRGQRSPPLPRRRGCARARPTPARRLT